MSNLDLFNEITAKVLSECYESFPVPLEFHQKVFFPNVSEKEPYAPFFYTMHWLEQYGYITFADTSFGAVRFDDVQLTEKALNALNCLPEAIAPKQTAGQRLKVAIGTGSKEIVFECLRQILSLGFSRL